MNYSSLTINERGREVCESDQKSAKTAEERKLKSIKAPEFNIEKPEAVESAYIWLRSKLNHCWRDGFQPVQIGAKILSRKLVQNSAIHGKLQNILRDFDINSHGVPVTRLTILKRLCMKEFRRDQAARGKQIPNTEYMPSFNDANDILIVHVNLETSNLKVTEADEFIEFLNTIPAQFPEFFTLKKIKRNAA